MSSQEEQTREETCYIDVPAQVRAQCLCSAIDHHLSQHKRPPTSDRNNESKGAEAGGVGTKVFWKARLTLTSGYRVI